MIVTDKKASIDSMLAFVFAKFGHLRKLLKAQIKSEHNYP